MAVGLAVRFVHIHFHLQDHIHIPASMARVRSERKGYDVIIYQQHVDRLKKMSPTVDSGPPREHPLSNKREMDKVG